MPTPNNPQRDEKCFHTSTHLEGDAGMYTAKVCDFCDEVLSESPSPKSEVSGEIKNPILLKLLESDEVKRHIDNLLLSQREHDREEMRKKVEGMKVKKCIKSHTNVAQCIMQDCKINSSHYDEALDTILALLK